MSFNNDFVSFVSAGSACLFIETEEADEIEDAVAKICNNERLRWACLTWNTEHGFVQRSGDGPTFQFPPAKDPLAVFRTSAILKEQAGKEKRVVIVLRNFFRYLSNPAVASALDSAITAGQELAIHYVITGPSVQVPKELASRIVVLSFPLPDKTELYGIVRGLDPESNNESPETLKAVETAAGLTRQEATVAFARSLAIHGKLDHQTVWDMKKQAIKKSSALTLHEGGDTLESLGGLQGLKEFSRKLLSSKSPHRPKGTLLLGVPGTGKSAFAKALGNEVGRPTVAMDTGALFGGIVGDTEANVRKALATLDAMAPILVYIDECEKSLAGGASGSKNDTGVAARMFGTFLTWLSDHVSEVYVVATCNDITVLPPEFARAERWDALFFLDLPSAEQRNVIWDLYKSQYGFSGLMVIPPTDENWTGAEIKACCRLASIMGITLVQAAQYVVPVATTASEKIQNLRAWAEKRAIDAETGTIYVRAENRPVTVNGEVAARRKVTRKA